MLTAIFTIVALLRRLFDTFESIRKFKKKVGSMLLYRITYVFTMAMIKFQKSHNFTHTCTGLFSHQSKNNLPYLPVAPYLLVHYCPKECSRLKNVDLIDGSLPMLILLMQMAGLIELLLPKLTKLMQMQRVDMADLNQMGWPMLIWLMQMCDVEYPIRQKPGEQYQYLVHRLPVQSERCWQYWLSCWHSRSINIVASNQKTMFAWKYMVLKSEIYEHDRIKSSIISKQFNLNSHEQA